VAACMVINSSEKYPIVHRACHAVGSFFRVQYVRCFLLLCELWVQNIFYCSLDGIHCLQWSGAVGWLSGRAFGL